MKEIITNYKNSVQCITCPRQKIVGKKFGSIFVIVNDKSVFRWLKVLSNSSVYVWLQI